MCSHVYKYCSFQQNLMKQCIKMPNNNKKEIQINNNRLWQKVVHINLVKIINNRLQTCVELFCNAQCYFFLGKNSLMYIFCIFSVNFLNIQTELYHQNRMVLLTIHKNYLMSQCLNFNLMQNKSMGRVIIYEIIKTLKF